ETRLRQVCRRPGRVAMRYASSCSRTWNSPGLRPMRPSVGLILRPCRSSRNCATSRERDGLPLRLIAGNRVVSIASTQDQTVPNTRIAGRRLSPARAVARQLGLHYVQQDDLTWRRLRRGKGFGYVREDGTVIRDRATVRRLASLAVPPAYA